MSRVKKVLTILLTVLFIVSLTAAASSAEPYHEHKHLDHGHLGSDDHDDHYHHHHDDDDCWVWSPTKDEYVYVC